MTCFRNVLFGMVGNDGLPTALERSAALARKSGAVLTVAKVLEGLPRDMHMLVPSAEPEALQQMACDDAIAQLEQLLAPFRQGADIRAKVLFGEPSVELIREAAEGNHDLLIVNSGARQSLKERLFGSSAFQLMRKSPCPVWVMRPAGREWGGRIMAAVNPRSDDESGNVLSKSVLEVAATLARVEESELHIVHVWNLPGEGIFRRRVRLPSHEVAALLVEEHHSAKAALEELLRQVDLWGVKHALHLTKGEPTRSIAEIARRKEVDVLVMGMTGRTGMAGFTVGNRAEQVFGALDCSILTVKAGSSWTPAKQQAA